MIKPNCLAQFQIIFDTVENYPTVFSFKIPVLFHLRLVFAPALVLLVSPPDISSVVLTVGDSLLVPFFVPPPLHFELQKLSAAGNGGTPVHV